MTALVDELTTNLKFVMAYAAITFKYSLAYRFDLFVKLAGYPARLLMCFFLWKVLVNNQIIQGYGFRDILTYYLLAYFLTQMYPFKRMARDIKMEIYSGDLVIFLARGVPHWAAWVGRFLATACAYCILVTPMAAALILLLGKVSVNPRAIIGFLALFLVGMMIKGQAWYLVGISTYYTEENMGWARLYDLAERLLSGALLPLFLFPEWFTGVSQYLPFHYTLYAPVQALLQPLSWTELGWKLLAGLAWCLAFAVFVRVVFNHGWRRFTAYGA